MLRIAEMLNNMTVRQGICGDYDGEEEENQTAERENTSSITAEKG